MLNRIDKNLGAARGVEYDEITRLRSQTGRATTASMNVTSSKP